MPFFNACHPYLSDAIRDAAHAKFSHNYTCKSSGKIAQTALSVDSSGFHRNFRQPGNYNFPLESTEMSEGTVFSLSKILFGVGDCQPMRAQTQPV